MTSFIKNFFDYKYLNDYNYIFRMIDNEVELIIDIYDNVSENRFNRYVFNFDSHSKNKTLLKEIHAILKPEDFLSTSNSTFALCSIGKYIRSKFKDKCKYEQ